MRVYLFVPCGHLLGKGRPLGSRLWCITVSLLLSQWYPGSMWYLIVSTPDLCTLTYFYFIVLLRSIGICVLCLYLAVPWIGLWSVIVAFSVHIHFFYENLSTVESR